MRYEIFSKFQLVACAVLLAVIGGHANAPRIHEAQGDFVFASRAAFEAADIPEGVDTWTVHHAGLRLHYVRDEAGTAIRSANGVTGVPAEDARPEHWGAWGDGVADDAPAIQSALAWRGRIQLRPGAVYLVGSSIGGDNVAIIGKGTRAGPHRPILRGLASIPINQGIVHLGRSAILQDVTIEYAGGVITGEEGEFERVGIFTSGRHLNISVLQKGGGLSGVQINNTGTGIAGGSFSASYRDIEIRDFSYAGFQHQRQGVTSGGTGSIYENIYITNSDQFRENPWTPHFGFALFGPVSGSVLDQINVEHATFRRTAVALDSRANLTIGSMHLEGVDLASDHASYIWLNGGHVHISALSMVFMRMTGVRDTGIIELGNAGAVAPRSHAGITETSTLNIGTLYLRAIPSPGRRHRVYHGYRGPSRVPGFSLFKRTDGASGEYIINLDSYRFLTWADVGEETVEDADWYRTAFFNHSDLHRGIVLGRFAGAGRQEMPNRNLGQNGSFGQWIQDSNHGQRPEHWATEPTDHRIHLSPGKWNRLDYPDYYLRINVEGPDATGRSLIWHIPDPTRIANSALTLSFRARANAPGIGLKDLYLQFDVSDRKEDAAAQILERRGDRECIEFTEDWRLYIVHFPAEAEPAMELDPDALRVVFHLDGPDNPSPKVKLDLSHVRLEAGARVTGVFSVE